MTGNGGGGAIALEDNSSTLNIYDGEISGNNGNGKGGAIYTKSGGTINMYGGRIAKNEAYRGGGLCLTGGSTFNMYGGLLENNSSTARWDTIPANSGNLYIAGGAVMNANAGVVRGGGYAVFNLGTIQTDDANYPATKFYSGLYNMGGVVKGGMYYGSYMSAGGNLGGCEVNYTLADSNLASYHYAWQFIEPGNTPTRPDDPTKTGYLFDGWYVGENAFDFSVPVTESVRVVAKWSKCDHTGSTAQPTCTDSAVCTVCGGTIAEKGHALIWQSENGEYWQKCSNCDFETEKKPIPALTLNAPDKVCRTQDCTFTFNLQNGCKLIITGYEFEKIGGDLSATLENGKYTVELGSSSYPAEENGFKITVSAETADGFAIKAEKSVMILNDHTGGTATCTAKAVCEVCKAEYGEKLPHDFTAETVDAKYLKSAATCTEKAVYYKSCAVCGLSSEGTADEATFFSGNALNHNWGAWTSNEDGTHTRTCTVDGCSAGTQTENCIDANKDHKCDICDYIISECADDNKDHKCDYCGKKLTEHTGGKATCKDKAKCEVCGAEYGELDPKNHTNLKHFPAKAATKTTEGNIEYWYCDGCGKYYSDKDGTKEIKKQTP
ncbi:MAG: InlB B-repeat-containing protein [Coprococcus sp.]